VADSDMRRGMSAPAARNPDGRHG